MKPEGVTRRKVLQTVGAGTAGLALAGEAAADGPREFNIGIEPDAAGAEREARRRAASVRKTIDFGDIGRVVVGEFTAEARNALENNPNVDYVEPNYTAEKLGEKLPVGIDRVDADVLHSEGTTGSGATVAILDTGVDDDHPDLADNIDPSLGAAFGSSCGSESGGCRFGREGYNGNDCNYEWSDDDDHGSHVAGTANAVRGNSEGVAGGVSTEATIMPVKVLSGCGSGSYADIADGVRYAADNGADVINMSLGGSSSDSTLKNACQYAYDNGVVLVASAGNDGECTDCVGYPAKYSTVMAVSAMDPRDDTLASFSSTGPEVELTAPGVDTLSTIPPESDDGSTYANGYETFSGTSMSAPHVAGGAGQVAANSSLTNTEVRQQLKDAAEDIGFGSNESGAGLLDAEAAVDSLGSTDGAPSVSWVNPADGDTVSGTVTIQIDASDSEDSDDSLEVDWLLGSSSRNTTYNSTSGYYEDSWDTTNESDGSYDITAEATDSAGNTTTTTITVSVDNTESAPAVDSLSASEVETGDSDAEFDVDWSVSDGDGDLSSLDLTLTDDTAGSTEETVTVSVSGSSDSGTTRLVAAGDDGSGNSYTVDATVSDSAGNTGTGSTTVSETESTNAAPSASVDALSDKSNPRWDRYDVDWSASDADGNLDTVVVEMLDSSGATLDSVTTSVSGSSASGVDEVRSKSNGAEVVVTATDTDGASGSDSRSI